MTISSPDLINPVRFIDNANVPAKRAARSFRNWYLDKFDTDEVEELRNEGHWHSEIDQARYVFESYGHDLADLYRRFQLLEPYEQEMFNDLRDRNVSIPDLMDYLRAESGFNPENRAVRPDLAASLRKRAFQAKSSRIEEGGRSAALAAGAVGLLGIGAWMAVAGLTPGLEASAPWVRPAWNAFADLMQTAAGGGAMVLVWKTWKDLQDLRSGVPRLNLGTDKDFADLPDSLGKIDYNKLNEEYESIPSAARHLIKHFSASELRVFLLGNDAVRLHVMRANPPGQRAKIESKLDVVARLESHWLRQLMSAAWAVVSSPWHRENNNARIPNLPVQMKHWREFAAFNKEHAHRDGLVGPPRPQPKAPL